MNFSNDRNRGGKIFLDETNNFDINQSLEISKFKDYSKNNLIINDTVFKSIKDNIDYLGSINTSCSIVECECKDDNCNCKNSNCDNINYNDLHKKMKSNIELDLISNNKNKDNNFDNNNLINNILSIFFIIIILYLTYKTYVSKDSINLIYILAITLIFILSKIFI